MLAAAANRLLRPLTDGALPVDIRRMQRFHALVAALDAFPMLQRDELGWYQLEPYDLLVAMGLVLRLAYVRLAGLYKHDKRVGRLLGKTEAGKRVLARIKAGELPPRLVRDNYATALCPGARLAVDKAISEVFGEIGENGSAAPGQSSGNEQALARHDS